MPELRKKSIAIRADASFEIGTGHVMRMLSLARGLTDAGADVTFITRAVPGNLIERISCSGYVLKILDATPGHKIAPDDVTSWLGAASADDLRQTFDNGFRPDITIADHYGVDMDWCIGARNNSGYLVCIDDEAVRPLSCDILVNQNYYYDKSAPQRQSLPANCIRLIGPEYAMLRPEFAALRPYVRVREKIDNILILMGGRDIYDIGRRIVEYIPRPPPFKVTVIGGNADTEDACDRNGFTFLSSSDRIADEMLKADFCFGAAGSTSWERACMGLPAALFVIADNQSGIAHNLALSGANLDLGDFRCFDFERVTSIIAGLQDNPARVAAMSRAAAQLTDGKGVERIIAKIKSLGS